jgi:hypothetical protein
MKRERRRNGVARAGGETREKKEKKCDGECEG